MSLKANLSIILQLHYFRNLALPHKARYALQVHIYQGKSVKVFLPNSERRLAVQHPGHRVQAQEERESRELHRRPLLPKQEV